MTLQECTFALTGLAFEFGQALDKDTYRAYHRTLGGIHASVFNEACRQIAVAPRTQYQARFPPPHELRMAAEKARRMLLAANPHEACTECADQKGWRTVLLNGQSRVERCPCVERHQRHLSGRGLLTPILALPGEDEPQTEQYYPKMAQLPADVRKRLEPIVERKQLR